MAFSLVFVTAITAQEQPNVLVIWGGDVGTGNIRHKNRRMMGNTTPNIDCIADEDLSFTDGYAEQSCIAGRAAFVGGNVPLLTA